MSNLPSVETRIFDGLAEQYFQQFGTDLVISQSADEVQKLNQRAQGQRLKYPLATAKVESIGSSESQDHYVCRYLLRKGILVRVGDTNNTAMNIRLLPAVFNLQVTYETNATVGEHSVVWYTKRWLQCARMGLLKFSIVIGYLRLAIGYTMDLNVTMPTDRVAPSEGETSYKVVTNMSIRGYMSETQLKETGMLAEVQQQELYGPNAHVWNFPTE